MAYSNGAVRSEPHFVITASGEIHGTASEENRETARRIRACVNACEGISTEDLEGGLIDEMCHTIAAVAPLLQQTVLGSEPGPVAGGTPPEAAD